MTDTDALVEKVPGPERLCPDCNGLGGDNQSSHVCWLCEGQGVVFPAGAITRACREAVDAALEGTHAADAADMDRAVEAELAMVLPGQIPPFLHAPTFDDRGEPRVCINGCLYLRADFAGDRTRAAIAALKEPTP